MSRSSSEPARPWMPDSVARTDSAFPRSQERRQDPVELVHLQKESVVAVGARQFAEGDWLSQLQEGLGHPPRLRRRKEPVGRQGHDQVAAAGSLEGLAQPHSGCRLLDLQASRGVPFDGKGIWAAAVGLGQIEAVHRLRDVQVAVGVEPLHEPLALVFQVLLDLEGGVEAVGPVVLADPPSELPGHALGGEVGDVRDLPRQGQPSFGAAGKEVFPTRPAGVVEDGLAFHDIEGQGLRGEGRRRRHADASLDAVGVAEAPFQRLHPTHGAAQDGVERTDAQVVQEQPLHLHHVPDGNVGEAAPEGFSGVRIDGGRSGGPRAAAEHAGADHEPATRVHGLAGSDHLVPPSLGAEILPRPMEAGHMAARRQGRGDQDGVLAIGVQGSVGFVGDLETRQDLSGFADEPAIGKFAPQDAGFHDAHGSRPVVGLGPIRHPAVVRDSHSPLRTFPGAWIPGATRA
jgi:hypothetical protein